MLYELLTGKRRLAGMPGMQVIDFLLKTKFAVPKIPQAHLPRRYFSILDNALAVDPEQRYQSIRVMREAFLSPSTSLLGQIDAVLIRENLKIDNLAGNDGADSGFLGRSKNRIDKHAILLGCAVAICTSVVIGALLKMFG
jgi:hypothetical protein